MAKYFLRIQDTQRSEIPSTTKNPIHRAVDFMLNSVFHIVLLKCFPDIAGPSEANARSITMANTLWVHSKCKGRHLNRDQIKADSALASSLPWRPVTSDANPLNILLLAYEAL